MPFRPWEPMPIFCMSTWRDLQCISESNSPNFWRPFVQASFFTFGAILELLNTIFYSNNSRGPFYLKKYETHRGTQLGLRLGVRGEFTKRCTLPKCFTTHQKIRGNTSWVLHLDFQPVCVYGLKPLFLTYFWPVKI